LKNIFFSCINKKIFIIIIIKKKAYLEQAFCQLKAFQNIRSRLSECAKNVKIVRHCSLEGMKWIEWFAWLPFSLRTTCA
jgi:hypothetical protein